MLENKRVSVGFGTRSISYYRSLCRAFKPTRTALKFRSVFVGDFVNHKKPFIDQWNIIKEIIDRSDTETFCVLYR